MWAQDGKLPQDARLKEAVLGQRYQPKSKSVIFLFTRAGSQRQPVGGKKND